MNAAASFHALISWLNGVGVKQILQSLGEASSMEGKLTAAVMWRLIASATDYRMQNYRCDWRRINAWFTVLKRDLS